MEALQTDYQILSDVYEKIRRLQKAEKKAPKTEVISLPQTIYQLINEGVQRINDLMITSDCSNHPRLLAMKLTFLYEKSKALVCEGKENSAEEILSDAFADIDERLSRREIIFSGLRMMNHLAYLLMKRDDLDRAREILEKGDSAYRRAKPISSAVQFLSNEELFSGEAVVHSSESWNKLERLVTSNLAMLGMIYEKLGLWEKYAGCQHEVLERQLDISGHELPVWAMKATKLACFFMAQNRFKEAKNHLATATEMLCKAEKKSRPLESGTTSPPKCPEFHRKYADVANCWVKYGLAIFSSSKMNAMKHFCQDSNEMLARVWNPLFGSPQSPAGDSEGIGEKNKKNARTGGKSQPTLSSISEGDEAAGSSAVENEKLSKYDGPLFLFEKLDLSEYDGVTDSLVDSTLEARILFYQSHTWLKQVKLFYTLQDHPIEYVNTIMDLNELYRYLAFFEEDIESQYSVHKLRADALETLSAVLREVRPHCYMAVSVEILRELAEVQMEMMGLNLRKIYAAQTALPDVNQTLQKIETLQGLNIKLKKFGKSLPGLEAPDQIQSSHS
ncbi:KIF-binding protein-like [Diachasmimorpha longicaudata]|uniref:KIF-binding protein-like n=1 Tax=Diachasmimorpha longicaudata TaxID=58733 RepID=UPI0030B89D3F